MKRAVERPYFSVQAEPHAINTSYRIKLFSGTANPHLAMLVADSLQQPLSQADVKTFANGEISIRVLDHVRGDDCFIIQPTTGNGKIDVNTALVELMLLIHTLKLASAKRITAVVPYFAYSRQDSKTQSRVPLSASAVAQLIQVMGVDRVVTLDLHCSQIQGFFRNVPVDNLFMFPEFCQYLQAQPWFDVARTVVVATGSGNVDRATFLADRLGVSNVVTILKRKKIGNADVLNTVGVVNGFVCILVNDIVDTASRTITASDLLKSRGATRVVACASHGILTHPATERITVCDALDEVIVSNSIPHSEEAKACSKLTVLSIAPMLAEAVRRLHNEETLSSMFTA